MVPGSPTKTEFLTNQPAELTGTATYYIDVSGIPTPGEPVTVELYDSVVGTQPLTSIVINAGSTLTPAAIATLLQTAIASAISTPTHPWDTYFSACTVTSASVHLVLQGSQNPNNVMLKVRVQTGSTLYIPKIVEATTVQGNYTEATAAVTFTWAGSNGVFTMYRGQRLILPTTVVNDMIAQGYIES
jgi:hypothetical protein